MTTRKLTPEKWLIMKLTANDWLKKYYPISASKLKNETVLEATQHSLQKWLGLYPTILKRYGLKISETGCDTILYKDSNAGVIRIDEATCALCSKFDICNNCPIYQETDGKSCATNCSDNIYDPYSEFIINHNPKPMISLLRKIIRKEKRKQKK